MISTISGGGGGPDSLAFTSSEAAVGEDLGRPNQRIWRANITIRNHNVALGVLCCCAFMQNVIVGGANNAILSTIEKAFYMTSVESAIFLSMYDVANIIASPIIGFFGDRKHKPKIISLSMLGLALGSCMMLLPNFVTPPASQSLRPTAANSSLDSIDFPSEDLLCRPAANMSHVETSTSYVAPTNPLFNNMKYVFYLANVLNGVSSVALYTIVISYIEAMFNKEQVHMRQGVYYAIGAIGVGVGMLTTGNFLNINGGLFGRRGKSSHSNSVTWVGAWWLIYIPAALINLVLALFVSMFSPSLARYQSAYLPPADHVGPQDTVKTHLVDFFSSARLIISNRVFVFIVLCTTTETFLIKGFSSYLSKYLEYQYRLAASTATMIVGALGFISLMLGVFLGSFLVKQLKWQIRQCAMFIVAILSFTCLLFLGLIISGPQEIYVGSVDPTFHESNCSCNSNMYYPVCYKHIYLFQTPCYAGCTRSITEKKFADCSVLGSLIELPGEAGNHTVVTELSTCPRPNPHGYRNLVVVAVFGFAILFLSSIIILPVLRIILESVSAENQSFALGIRSLVNKTFGNIPGPLVFAAIVDQSCIQWISNRNRSGKTCVLYNNKRFSAGLAFLGFGVRFTSAIFAAVTLMHINRSEKRKATRTVKCETSTKMSVADSEDAQNSVNLPESFTYLNKAYTSDAADVDKADAHDENGSVLKNEFEKTSSQI